MPELIVSTILVVSLVVLGVMVYRKIPALLKLPETATFHFDWKAILDRTKGSFSSRGFSPEVLLQKILSRVRILTLKTDSQTSSWLQKLRERSRKKKSAEEDNYWQEVKKSTKK